MFTALALITLDFRGSTGIFGSARDTTLNVLGPVRSVADWVMSPFRDAWNGITGFDELEAENARLRLELESADNSNLEVADLRRIVLEFELLEDLRTSASLSERVVARVIDEPLSNFERTIELNKGSNDGIEVGMPVEAGRGLVGRVVQVVRNRSRVELITDASFGVAVRLVRSGDIGVARGNGDGSLLTIEFVKVDTVVIPGENVRPRRFTVPRRNTGRNRRLRPPRSGDRIPRGRCRPGRRFRSTQPGAGCAVHAADHRQPTRDDNHDLDHCSA